MCICCVLVGLDNKDEINIVPDFVDPRGTLFFVFVLTNFYGAALPKNRIRRKHVTFYALLLHHICTYSSKSYCIQQAAFGTNADWESLLIFSQL